MSKKLHVTMSPEDYAALQKWQQQQAALQQRKGKKQQQEQPPKPHGGGLDGFTVFLLALLAALGAWGWLS